MHAPHRILNAAVTALREAGWAQADALQLVIDVADQVMRRTPPGSSPDWIYQVQAQARVRLVRLGRAAWMHDQLAEALRTGARPNAAGDGLVWAVEEQPAQHVLRITARWADGERMQAERPLT